MSRIEIVQPRAEHGPELARILFEAFKGIHDRHHFPRDIPSMEVGAHLMEMLLSRPDFEGVAAVVDGKVVGSNFLFTPDAVGGVGPLTVDPAHEGRGIGRALMCAVLGIAERRRIPRVRLLQDSFNTRSLSLYASLGFDVREPVGLMDIKPAEMEDRSVRPLTEADLPKVGVISQDHFTFGRRTEIANALRNAVPAFVREREGGIVGYLIPGFLGHGAVGTVEDALALVGQAARQVPEETRSFFCPLTQGDFYRASLKQGHRLRKIMTYMTVGPFELPEEVWMPSILY